MITYANPLQGDILCEAAQREPIIGGKIYTLYQCYKNVFPFCDMYLIFGDALQTVVHGLVCRYHGTVSVMILDYDDVDFDELAAFLNNCGAAEVECLEQAGKRLLPLIIGDSYNHSAVLKFTASQIDMRDDLSITKDCALMKVHGLLCECFESFGTSMPLGTWFVDTSARVRKGGCFVFGIKDENAENEVVCTAGVYSICPTGAVIASVATTPAYRGKGYATACVAVCLNELQSLGIPAYIVAASEELVLFYQRMGFEICEERYTLNLTQNQFPQ